MENMIAYCGVNCAECPDYRNKVCPSCKKTQWKEDDICMPVKCCREKKIEFCAQCDTFPCADMKEFYEESEGHKQAYCLMCSMREDEVE